MLLLLALAFVLPFSSSAEKNKKTTTATETAAGPRKFSFDPTKLVWPSPPNIARVRWLDYFAGAKVDYTPGGHHKTKVHMDGSPRRRPVPG